MSETQETMQLQTDVAVVGAGPAGLMAAEVLAQAGLRVGVFDAMPSAGRKFLLAGKGGMNITHSEPAQQFLPRYGTRQQALRPMLDAFGAEALRAWVEALGISTFVGTSGRVFPKDMKAAPLLRAWLHRLRGQGVQFHMRQRWTGWDDTAPGDSGHTLVFDTPAGSTRVQARAVLLALGGASWPRLGSTGDWVALLQARGVQVAPLQPSNCGFDVTVSTPDGGWRAGWSEHFTSRFAGQPFKLVAITVPGPQGPRFARKGEFVATQTGVEGSLVYAASALLRDDIAAQGQTSLLLDLLPDLPAPKVLAEVAHPRGSRSLSSHLKSRLGLDGIKLGLLYELLPKEAMARPEALARAIKALPLHFSAARPVAEAISSAGGVAFEAMAAGLMLQALPGVWCAGEMLDWEAPTGGYLLTACFATGRHAGLAAAQWLAKL
jgi:uncharacterized flavoprotein (TIGR03862 family)